MGVMMTNVVKRKPLVAISFVEMVGSRSLKEDARVHLVSKPDAVLERRPAATLIVVRVMSGQNLMAAMG